jgi:hypothetical protein
LQALAATQFPFFSVDQAVVIGVTPRAELIAKCEIRLRPQR